MLKLQPYEIESYLREKGLRVRTRGGKREAEICPFCAGGEHKDKWTFVVYTDGGNYKCMRGSCARTGNFWSLAEFFNDDPKQFYKFEKSMNPPNKIENIIAAHRPQYHDFAKENFEPQPLTEEARKYLKMRGFSDEVLEAVKICCDERGNIAFPYQDKNGECCLVKLRKPRKPLEKEPKAWQKWKGGLRTLWGFEEINYDVPSLIITFGEYDRIAVVQSRLENVVSVPCGDSDTAWIDICFNELQRFQEIYLWTDNDEAGNKCLPAIANRLGKERIRVVKTPYKDANEMLLMLTRQIGQTQAENKIFEAVAQAEWYWTGDLVQVADIGERELNIDDGIQTGIKFLDKTLGGFLNGKTTIHTGDSGAGKSTVLSGIVSMALEQNEAAAVWSGEDDDFDYKYRLSVHLAGYEGTEMRQSQRSNREYAVIKDEYKTRINKFVRDRLFLYSLRRNVTEDVLFDVFELAYKRYGCRQFVVDNLMKLVLGKNFDDKYSRQADIINKGCDFAKDLGVHVHFVAHIKKTGTPFEPPTKDNVSGAKDITNLADNALAWWRIPDKVKGDYENMDTLVCVLKNRLFGDEGQIGLRFDPRVKRVGRDLEELGRLYSL